MACTAFAFTVGVLITEQACVQVATLLCVESTQRMPTFSSLRIKTRLHHTYIIYLQRDLPCPPVAIGWMSVRCSLEIASCWHTTQQPCDTTFEPSMAIC